MWIYISTPHTPLWRSTYLVKHRENFTLPYLRISSETVHYSVPVDVLFDTQRST
jgi:hypothetical protein